MKFGCHREIVPILVGQIRISSPRMMTISGLVVVGKDMVLETLIIQQDLIVVRKGKVGKKLSGGAAFFLFRLRAQTRNGTSWCQHAACTSFVKRFDTILEIVDTYRGSNVTALLKLAKKEK